MRALVILLATLVGGALGLFGPVLVAIALNVGSTSYASPGSDSIPISTGSAQGPSSR